MLLCCEVMAFCLGCATIAVIPIIKSHVQHDWTCELVGNISI